MEELSSVLSGKGMAILLLVLLAGALVGALIIAPVIDAAQQKQQKQLLSYLGGNLASGTIYIAGSTTVLPITQAIMNSFTARYPLINLQTTGGGSGMGYSSIISGASPIGAASRSPTSVEISSATANGVKLVGYAIGCDAVCIIYNQATITQLNLTRAQVKDIFERAGTANPPHWNEYNSTWPATEINIYIREAGSGTRGDFESSGIAGFNIIRSDWSGVLGTQTSNGAMKQAVMSTTDSMGYISISYDLSLPIPQTANIAFNSSYQPYTPTKASVKAWAISQLSTPGDYSGSGYFACRFLYYVTNGIPASGSLSDRYLDFIYGSDGQAIIDGVNYVSVTSIGYIPLPQAWN